MDGGKEENECDDDDSAEGTQDGVGDDVDQLIPIYRQLWHLKAVLQRRRLIFDRTIGEHALKERSWAWLYRALSYTFMHIFDGVPKIGRSIFFVSFFYKNMATKNDELFRNQNPSNRFLQNVAHRPNWELSTLGGCIGSSWRYVGL